MVLGGSSTTVLDTATGNVRWTKDGISHATVDGDRVIGVPAAGSGGRLPLVVALRGSDGNQLWASPAPTTSYGNSPTKPHNGPRYESAPLFTARSTVTSQTHR